MQQQISPLHETAREFAKAGIKVFPCAVGDKTPISENGFHDATTNLEQIDAWWGENPQYNLALSPHDAGWCVVEIEGYGLETWAKLTADLEVPDTYAVRSPRGGIHLYFKGELPGSVRKLFKGEPIDTRGRGSYVLIPPSIITTYTKPEDTKYNGQSYEVISDVDVAPLPAWITPRLREQDERHAASHEGVDEGANLSRARRLLADYVGRGDVAIEGRGGDQRTYQLACELHNLGISPEKSVEILELDWNPHCQPPWSHDELVVKCENASRYAQNEQGAWATPPAADVFGTVLDNMPASSEPEARTKFHFEDEAEMEQGEDPTWLIPDLIPEKATVLLYGPTQSYKSFLALDVACSISTGTETFGTSPTICGPTFYGALEGRTNIKRKRRLSWKVARGVDALPDFYVGPAPMIAMPDEVQQFGDAIVKRCAGRVPRLVIIDTASKAMVGLDENNAGDASKFIRFCDSLVEHLGCTVMAIGHTGKDGERGHRGSSAFPAGFDTVIRVRADRATKAVQVNVEKHKDAEEREVPWFFEGRSIGQSLAFFPISADAHRMLTASDKEFTPKKIGSALQTLGAFGEDKAVTTTVLASAVVEQREGQAVEEHQEAVARAARSLQSLAKTKLEAYCERSGRELMWSLPAPASE